MTWFDDFMEWLMDYVMPFIIIGTLLLAAFAVAFGVYQGWKATREWWLCARWEQRIVHQPAYTAYIMVGKVMVPKHFPDRDVREDVCVEPRWSHENE